MFGVVSLPAKAQAQEATEEHTIARNFKFKATCEPLGGFSTVSVLVGPAQEEAAAGYSLLDLGPSCKIQGDDLEATFACDCKSEVRDAQGSLPPFAFSDDDLVNGASDKILAKCDELVQTHCGPFVEPIRETCEDEHGGCEVIALGKRRNGAYNDVTVGCICASGSGWSSEVGASLGVDLDPDYATKACQAELAGCAPEATPGPNIPEVFPAASVEARRVSCIFEAESADRYDACQVTEEWGRRRVECECGDESRGSEGPSEKASTTQELYTQCMKELAVCDPQAQPDGAKPGEPNNDEDCNDVDDILDGMGCSAAQESGSLLGLLSGIVMLWGRRRWRFE